MINILVIGMSSVLGGVETYLYNLIKHMDKKNIRFDFLIVGENKSVFEDEINGLFNDGKNHFYYCPNLKKKYFYGKKWLEEFYSNNNYDFVYLNTCTSARIQYCFIPLRKGAKLISHSHNGNGDSKINNMIFRNILSKKSKYKLACSDKAATWLFGEKCNDYIIIPNGIDIDRFAFNNDTRIQLRNELNFQQDEVVIGHVGRFSDQKNHGYFINLATELPNNYKFLLIGDGENKDSFLSKVAEHNLGNRFVVLSARDDIEKYYNAMDLFVMPSLYEGLPIVSIEAQTNGLKCVFSDAVSRQSNLSNECKFISLSDLEQWKSTILQIDKQRLNGAEIIKQNGFDIQSSVDKIHKIITE